MLSSQAEPSSDLFRRIIDLLGLSSCGVLLYLQLDVMPTCISYFGQGNLWEIKCGIFYCTQLLHVISE